MNNRNLVIVFGCITLAAAIVSTSFFFRKADAQRSASNRFEYAVINGSYAAYPADGAMVAAAVNICYLQTGCQNEEVRTDLSISKFLQDERIENSGRTRALAQERAVQVSFAKAISKLGNDGWEIISTPVIEFDVSYTNQQGVQSVKEGLRTERQHVWFKRPKQ